MKKALLLILYLLALTSVFLMFIYTFAAAWALGNWLNTDITDTWITGLLFDYIILPVFNFSKEILGTTENWTTILIGYAISFTFFFGSGTISRRQKE